MIHTKRKPIFGNKRSKSMQKTKKKFSLNIQKKKILIGNIKKTLKLSIKEFRTIKKLNQDEKKKY